MQHNLEELKNLDIDHDGETTFGNYTITVSQDTMAESPREWDNLGTMVCWHRSYNLGDEDGAKEHGSARNFFVNLSGMDLDHDYITDEQYDRAVKRAHELNIILPLYLYDHSGITMNTTGFSCGWDSGQVGHIYVSLEKIRKEFGCKRVSKKQRALVEKYLTGEVESYDDYLTGNVYGFNIEREDEDGEQVDVDSCWGYFGYPCTYMLDEIKSNIKYDIENTPEQFDLPLPEPEQMEITYPRC